jgi:hypothetical protein
MMSDVSNYELASDIYETFRKRVFTILFNGYLIMRQKREDFSNTIEEGITGMLCDCMENYLNNPDSEEWVICYSIHQEHPISSNNETGRRRKRLDIRFRCGETRPGNEFIFEAKRLNNNISLQKYLGSEGIQRFLNGRYPVNKKGEAAMLGYVQSKDIKFWIKRLSNNLKLEQYSIIPELTDTFRSCHKQLTEKQVVLFHILLDFSPL